MSNRKTLLLLIFIMASTLLISACSSGSDMIQDLAPQESVDSLDNEMGYAGDGSADEEATSEDKESIEPEKIITTVYMEMQTKEFIPTRDRLDVLISKYKGYIQNSNISYNDYVYSDGLKYANYSIRIPSESLDAFIDDIIAIGNIISQSKNKEDISKSYRDTESRLRVLEIKEERILSLLEKAQDMEDIIVLENQLSDLIYQKEELNQDLSAMDEKVDYSTVDLNIEEVAKLTPGGNSKAPFIEKLQTAFKDSFYFFTRNSGELLIGLVYFLPYAIILALIGYLVYRFTRRRKKDTDKRKTKDIDKN